MGGGTRPEGKREGDQECRGETGVNGRGAFVEPRSMFLRQRRCNFMVTNGSEVRALMWQGWRAVKL